MFVVSDGSGVDNVDTATSLLSALAQTVKAIRSSILEARKPANLNKAMTTKFESLLPPAAFLAGNQDLRAKGVDMLLTNWNHAGHDSVDFGKGSPTGLSGYFELHHGSKIGIIALSQEAFGIRIPLHSVEGLHRLKRSSVLPALAPQSGLLGGID